MASLGMSCNYEGKRPVIRGVVLGGDEPVRFEYVCDRGHSMEQQLLEAHRWIQGRLRTLDVQVAVVRVQDFHPKFKPNPINVSNKASFEGVLVATAACTVPDVRRMSGRDIGAACGSSKEDAEAEAAVQFGEEFKEAGAAALAGQAVTTADGD